MHHLILLHGMGEFEIAQRFFPRVVTDRVVDTGNLIYNSHVGYWQNRDIAKAVVDTILEKKKRNR